jgi:hypothetical protein
MTGRLPSAHGLQLNGRELSHGERTFVQLLRETGYRTALVGKSHLQNITAVPPAWPKAGARLKQDARALFPGRYGQEVASSWDQDDNFDLTLPYYGFEQVALTVGHADEQSGHWRRWLRRQIQDADRLIGPENAIPTPDLALSRLRQAWRTRVPEALYPTNYIAQQSCEMLRDHIFHRMGIFYNVRQDIYLLNLINIHKFDQRSFETVHLKGLKQYLLVNHQVNKAYLL